MKQFLSPAILLLFTATVAAQDSLYKHGPDSQRNITVPKGVVTTDQWLWSDVTNK